jgi:hypothetical protein
MIGAIAKAALGLAFALAVFGFHYPIPTTLTSERDEVFLPRPSVAKIAAIGFDAVASDYYWIQALYKVGNSRQNQSEYSSYITKIIELVTVLNPWVDHPYRFAAIWLTDSEESVRNANEILQRGIGYHPDDWRNHFYLGFNQFYYLSENEKAADTLETCISKEGAPPYIARLVARLRSENADIESAAIFLQQMVMSAEREGERAVYQGALDEIEVETKARFLENARAQFNQLHGRDIAAVEDLRGGDHPMLSGFPRPEPDALPPSRQKGDYWYLDEETGKITSTYYGRRYQVNMTHFHEHGGFDGEQQEVSEDASEEGKS